MTRPTLPRRYAPLVAALAVQLVIIVTAPSTAQKGAAVSSPGNAAGTAGAGEGVAQGPGVESATGAGGVAGPGAVAGATGGAGGAGAGGATPPGAAAAGDTTHCSGGREF